MKGKGHRFVIFKKAELWHWNLIVSNSPSPKPVAQSGKGYNTIEEKRHKRQSSQQGEQLLMLPMSQL